MDVGSIFERCLIIMGLNFEKRIFMKMRVSCIRNTRFQGSGTLELGTNFDATSIIRMKIYKRIVARIIDDVYVICGAISA